MTQGSESCLACGSDKLTMWKYADDVEHRGVQLPVEGLVRMHCENCGHSFVTPEQYDCNLSVVKAAYRQAIDKERKEKGLLSGPEIRAVRERLNITQREAAELFGGGLNAFSKYENQEVVQSTPMDKLIRVASNLGIEAFRQALVGPVELPIYTAGTARVHVVRLVDDMSVRLAEDIASEFHALVYFGTQKRWFERPLLKRSTVTEDEFTLAPEAAALIERARSLQ